MTAFVCVYSCNFLCTARPARRARMRTTAPKRVPIRPPRGFGAHRRRLHLAFLQSSYPVAAERHNLRAVCNLLVVIRGEEAELARNREGVEGAGGQRREDQQKRAPGHAHRHPRDLGGDGRFRASERVAQTRQGRRSARRGRTGCARLVRVAPRRKALAQGRRRSRRGAGGDKAFARLDGSGASQLRRKPHTVGAHACAARATERQGAPPHALSVGERARRDRTGATASPPNFPFRNVAPIHSRRPP